MSAEIAITKAQLKALQPCYGLVNSDTGRVLLRVEGRRHQDGLYHVVAIDRPLEANETLEEFSLRELLDGTN